METTVTNNYPGMGAKIPLLEAQDTVLRAYFAQKYGQMTVCGDEGSRAAKPRGLAHLGLEVYA